MKLLRFLIKFTLIISLLVLLLMGGAWYYVTNKVADHLNEEYANKSISLNVLGEKYIISCKKFTPTGFPYRISWQVDGYNEETISEKLEYNSPVYFGYNLMTQKIFAEYQGHIDVTDKLKPKDVGVRVDIKDIYRMAANFPLSFDLLSTVKNMKDNFELINYLGDLNIYTGNVDIFDLNDNKKIHSEEFESAFVSFKPQKYYTSKEDFLNNIPQYVKIKYEVKTDPVLDEKRELPKTVLYGFSLLPSSFDVNMDIELKTRGNNLEEIYKGLEIKANAKALSDFMDFNDLKFEYSSGNGKISRGYKAKLDSKIFFKNGMFQELFDRYDAFLAPEIKSSYIGGLVDREIQYLKDNRELFKFKQLENRDYDFGLDIASYNDGGKHYTKIEDFNIFSKGSGFRLKHEVERSFKDRKKWKAKGVLLMHNYLDIVEFSSGYIYRFGKFKHLNDEARALYVSVNKDFLKTISDYPDSKSNNLSFEYSADSKHLMKSNIGSVRVDQIANMYSLMLYKKLFGQVDKDGDILKEMKKILPDINEDEPMLKKILPKISNAKELEKNAKKSLKKELDKALRDKAEKAIKRSLPKNLRDKLLNQPIK